MALKISASQAKANMGALGEQWLADHLERIDAEISAASGSGRVSATYGLQIVTGDEGKLDRLMLLLKRRGLDVNVRAESSAMVMGAVPSVVAYALAALAAPAKDKILRDKVILDIGWAERQGILKDPGGSSIEAPKS